MAQASLLSFAWWHSVDAFPSRHCNVNQPDRPGLKALASSGLFFRTILSK